MKNKLFQIMFFLLGSILFNTVYGNNDSLSRFFKNLELEARESTFRAYQHGNCAYLSIAYALNHRSPGTVTELYANHGHSNSRRQNFNSMEDTALSTRVRSEVALTLNEIISQGYWDEFGSSLNRIGQEFNEYIQIRERDIDYYRGRIQTDQAGCDNFFAVALLIAYRYRLPVFLYDINQDSELRILYINPQFENNIFLRWHTETRRVPAYQLDLDRDLYAFIEQYRYNLNPIHLFGTPDHVQPLIPTGLRDQFSANSRVDSGEFSDDEFEGARISSRNHLESRLNREIGDSLQLRAAVAGGSGHPTGGADYLGNLDEFSDNEDIPRTPFGNDPHEKARRNIGRQLKQYRAEESKRYPDSFKSQNVQGTLKYYAKVLAALGIGSGGAALYYKNQESINNLVWNQACGEGVSFERCNQQWLQNANWLARKVGEAGEIAVNAVAAVPATVCGNMGIVECIKYYAPQPKPMPTEEEMKRGYR